MQEINGTHVEAGGPGKLEPIEPPTFSDPEKRALELYDKLQQLQLELALEQARRDLVPDTTQSVTEQVLDDAKARLLEAKATHGLRNDVVDSVMTIVPILKAVHNATQASPVERDLLPYIERRDAVSVSIAEQTSTLRSLQTRLAGLETENIKLSRQNVALASELLQLADEAEKTWKAALDHDGGNGAQRRGIREKMKRIELAEYASRRRWRILKETVSAVVVGSGIDWVHDKRLREMVLDED